MTEKRFNKIKVYLSYEVFDNNNHKQLDVDRVVDLLNEQHETITKLKKDFDSCSHNWDLMYDEAKNKVEELLKENEQLKQELRLKEEKKRINCRNCSYFVSYPSSDCCLKREDIGYKGTCIDGMDYYYLAKNCPYY